MNTVSINVKDILGDVGAEKSYSFEQPFTPIKSEFDTYEFTKPVTFNIRVQGIGNGVRVKGQITSAMKLICSRCLNEFSFDIDWNIDEMFYSHDSPEEDSYMIKDTMIDLGPPTEEQFLLALPIKPLCSESCKGICPTCGQPLDEEHRPHDDLQVDPRLEALKKFFDKS